MVNVLDISISFRDELHNFVKKNGGNPLNFITNALKFRKGWDIFWMEKDEFICAFSLKLPIKFPIYCLSFNYKFHNIL